MLETAQSKSPELIQPHGFQGEAEVKTGEMTYSESIAILLAETFINSKWDKDIDEEMRNIRKHIKDLKDSHRIESLQKELDRLSHMQLHTK